MVAEPLRVGSVFADDWQIEKVLHAGAISVVYEATQRSTGARRALKVIGGEIGKNPEFLRRFLDEARRATRIKSEHVAEVLDCGVAEELPFVVLELLVGNSLEQELLRAEALPLEQARTLLAELGHALAAAHDAGVVHRDLKPEGIILAASQSLAGQRRVEVQFVGAAKVAAEALGNTTAAMSRPLWMAPEQGDAGNAVGPAADVWSYGLLAFFVLTGRHYWKTARDAGSAMMTLLREVLYEPLVPASIRAEELGVTGKLPPGFDAWFSRCVERDPAARFGHAREAAQALSQLLGGMPTALPLAAGPGVPQGAHPAWPVGTLATTGQRSASAPPPAAANRKPSRIWPFLLAALAVFAVFGGGGYFAWARYQANEKAAARAEAEAAEEAKAERDKERAEKERKEREAANWAEEDSPIPISSKDAHNGARTAPVTLVVFTDLECPFCKKLESTLDAVQLTHGADQVRLVYKHNPLPFHKSARPAAELAARVYAKKGFLAFANFKSRVFATKGLSQDELETMALDAGLSSKDLSNEMAIAAASAKVEADIALAKDVSARGTPTTFINGIRLSGAQTREKFDALIELELAEAKREVAAGLAPEKVYAARSKANFSTEEALPDKPKPEKDDSLWSVPIGESPSKGPKDALVTIVIFSDFQCPFCARVVPTLEQVEKEYAGRVRMVWKDQPLPFHKRAEAAANFAREVRAQKGDPGFWQAHNLLFENTKALEDADLRGYASKLGVSANTVLAAVHSSKHQKAIDEDKQLASGIEVKGTPHFFVNGRRLIGAQPFEKFKDLIDSEESKAKTLRAELLAKGKSGDVYAYLVETGRKAGDLETKDPGPIPLGSPRRGAKSPKVVLQWFSDFECPFCAKSEPVMDDVIRDYGDKVMLVYRHLPLDMHKNARTAAIASEEVRSQLGDEAFFRFADGVYSSQLGSAKAPLDRLALLGFASKAAGGGVKALNAAAFSKALHGTQHDARIDADIAEAKRLGITGTPGFLIDRYYVGGYRSFSDLRPIIDRALREAK